MNQKEEVNKKGESSGVKVSPQKKVAIMSVLLPMAALSVFLTRPAMAGSGCYFGDAYHTDGSCVDTDCFWWWDHQQCTDGVFQPCGSC